MSANNGTTLSTIRQNMPTPAESRQAVRRLTTLGRITDEDVQDILGAQIKKAKAGDTAAAKLILDYTIGRADQKPTSVNVENLVIEQQPEAVPKSKAKARHRIAEIIATNGPLTARVIAVRSGLRPDVVESCLEHDWFEEEQDGWHITNAARAEVMEKDDD